MKLKIGENIKQFRKQSDITQETLAEMLGVSTQSVSRWELGTCYPDMELLPVLSDIFKVSVDTLIGADDTMEKAKTGEYLARFQEAISKGRIDDCIRIAREGVAEFPNNYVLLNKLMYALFLSGDDTGNIPDWKENMSKYDDEIVSLGERIIKYCPDQDIRLEATYLLAFQHVEMGRRAIGRAMFESLPTQEFCRENRIWWALEEDEKLPFLRNRILDDYGLLCYRISRLVNYADFSDEEAIAVIEKALAIEKIIWDGKIPMYSNTMQFHLELAKLCARIGNTEKMYEHLNACADCAKNFDHLPDTLITNSLILGEVLQKRTDRETADTRSLCVILREDRLLNSVFNKYRNTPEFRSILEKLA